MATHVITVLCDSPADAASALEQIRSLGFPIEGQQIDGNELTIWVDMHKTDGILNVVGKIRRLGYKPYTTSERNG